MRALFLRFAARARRTVRIVVSIAVFSIVFATLFVLAMVIHSGIFSVPDRPWRAWLYAGTLFGILGALFGTILVLDRTADPVFKPRRFLRTFNRPVLRAGLCGAWGALAVIMAVKPFTVVLPIGSVFLGASVGAILGWFGWRWAKYVDF